MKETRKEVRTSLRIVEWSVVVRAGVGGAGEGEGEGAGAPSEGGMSAVWLVIAVIAPANTANFIIVLVLVLSLDRGSWIWSEGTTQRGSRRLVL